MDSEIEQEAIQEWAFRFIQANKPPPAPPSTPVVNTSHAHQQIQQQQQQQHWRPFVTLTYAQSIDGFIGRQHQRHSSATANPPPIAPLLLSGPKSIILTHALRASHHAILVGIGTILNDNPRLNVRLPCNHETTRTLTSSSSSTTTTTSTPLIPVILDPMLRLPPSAKIIQFHPVVLYNPLLLIKHDNDNHNTITATTDLEERIALLLKSNPNITLIPIPSPSSKSLHQLQPHLRHFNLETCMSVLYSKLGITSVMVEGGSRIIQSFLFSYPHLIDWIVVTMCPRYLGTGVHVTSISSSSSSANDHAREDDKNDSSSIDTRLAINFKSCSYHPLGHDIIISATLR